MPATACKWYHTFMKTISVVVPAYNEEKNIDRTLATLSEAERFSKIVCVNDGSRDATEDRIKKFKKVHLINIAKNKGKGYALAEGIGRTKSELVLLLDADLTTLNKQHIEQMIDPILHSREIDVVVGYEYGKFISVFSGQRVYYRKDLLPILNELRKSKYGVEVLLNAVFRNKTVKYVQLENLGHVDKFSKFNKIVWFYNYFTQWFVMVLGQVIKYGISKEEFKTALEEQGVIISEKFKEYKASRK